MTDSRTGPRSALEANKATVRTLVEQVLNRGWLELIDQLYAPERAAEAGAWIAPLRRSFPGPCHGDRRADRRGDAVVGRYTCSATHLETWLGHPGTGRRFDRVAEVGIYRLRDTRIVEVRTLGDTHDRRRQLRLPDPVSETSGA